LQRGRPVLEKKEADICPVLAILPYQAVRGPLPGALFVLADSYSLTCHHLTTSLSAILSKVSLDSSCYNMHTFHIRDAISAKEAGISDYQVQMLRR